MREMEEWTTGRGEGANAGTNLRRTTPLSSTLTRRGAELQGIAGGSLEKGTQRAYPRVGMRNAIICAERTSTREETANCLSWTVVTC